MGEAKKLFSNQKAILNTKNTLLKYERRNEKEKSLSNVLGDSIRKGEKTMSAINGLGSVNAQAPANTSVRGNQGGQSKVSVFLEQKLGTSEEQCFEDCVRIDPEYGDKFNRCMDTCRGFDD